MIAIHISINDGEYVERVKTSAKDYFMLKSLYSIRLDDLVLQFDNEIIALTSHRNTLWLNPKWRNSPYAIDELLPHYPLGLTALTQERVNPIKALCSAK
jgi:hypothetical protein